MQPMVGAAKPMDHDNNFLFFGIKHPIMHLTSLDHDLVHKSYCTLITSCCYTCDMDTIQLNKKVQSILDSVRFITVATVSAEGNPWNTPVTAFRFKASPVFYWASWRDAQHSQNIRANGRVFIVAYDSTPADGKMGHGVYMDATATELTDESEVLQAALVFEGDKYKLSDGTQYLGDHPLRIYKASPINLWINGDMHVGGYFVDVRVEAQ